MAKEKKKPTPKPKKDNSTDEIKRHMSVLMEQMGSQVKLIGEQYGTIINKLEDHDQRFDRLETEVYGMKIELDAIKRVVERNSRDIKDLKLGQQEIKEKLDTTTANHEQRIQRLEAKVGI